MKKILSILVAVMMAAGVMAEEKNDLTAKVFQREYSDVKVVFTNHSDKTIESAEIRLFYYDEQGTQFHYQDKNVSIRVEPGLSITKEIYIDDVARSGSKNVTAQVRSYSFQRNEQVSMGSLFGDGKGSGQKSNPVGHGRKR